MSIVSLIFIICFSKNARPKENKKGAGAGAETEATMLNLDFLRGKDVLRGYP